MSLWLVIPLVYLSAGLVIVLATPARCQILKELKDRSLEDQPGWKVFLFRIIVCTGGLVLWPLFLKSWFGARQNPPRDDLLEDVMYCFRRNRLLHPSPGPAQPPAPAQ